MAPTDILPAQAVDLSNVNDYPEKLADYLRNVEAYKTAAAAKGNSQAGIQTSGPQGKVVPLTIVDDPADWTAKSLRGKEAEYTYTLTQEDVAELISATEKIKSRIPATEEGVKQLTKEDYELPNFGPKFIDAVKNVSLGRGFQLIKGFPVEHFKKDRLGLVIAFWGLGLIVGTPQVSQTDYDRKHETFGSLLNHVTVGRHTSVKGPAVYPQSNVDEGQDGPDVHKKPRDASRLAFHSDQGATDLIALLCLTQSKAGGESKWVSAIAIHNELLRRGRKDLVEELSKPGVWTIPKKWDQASFRRDSNGKHIGFEEDPPFIYHNGYLSSHYATANYQELDLTPLQKEAVWAFAALAEDPEFHLSARLQPGEIEIISNQFILHSRSDIIDGETPDQKRHLVRWWVAQPKERNPRGIIPTFAPRSNVRPEGGFAFPGDRQEWKDLRLPFYPYTRHDELGESEW